MPAVTAGVAAIELAPANSERVVLVVYNAGSADEIVRVDLDREAVATSANVIHNRETFIFRGPIAKRRIWVISDTATTTVNYTEII